MPAELPKLDAESSKRRNRHTKYKEKKVVADVAAEAAAMRVAQHKAGVTDKEAILAKAHALLVLGSSVTPEAYSAPPRHDHGETRFSMFSDCGIVAPSRSVGVIDSNATPGYSGAG
ncbi:Subtilisin-like protease [Hordeum vulgare]|nr:Subtilisin-like protease [Hordeum vulgare]